MASIYEALITAMDVMADIQSTVTKLLPQVNISSLYVDYLKNNLYEKYACT